MTYVTITTKQKLSDAQALRDYLSEAEQFMPRSVQTAQVHVWLEYIAAKIEADSRLAVLPVTPLGDGPRAA